MNRKSGFDVLRLFLALEVVAMHCFTTNGKALFNDPPLVAVPAFVCLSGFLIPGSYETSRGAGHFAWKRLLRVYPAFLVSFLLVWLIAGARALGPSMATYLTMGLVSLPFAANLPLWSLMVEEVLYGGHVASRLLKAWSNRLPVVMIGICFAVWLWLGYQGITVTSNRANILVLTTMAYFIGNLLYVHKAKLAKIPTWVPVAVLFCSAAWPYIKPSIDPMYLAWAYPFMLRATLASAAAVVLAERLPWSFNKMPDFSYGIYIYHWPLMLLLRRFGLADGLLLCATLVSTGLFAAISWYTVEEPILKLKNGLPTRSAESPEVPRLRPSRWIRSFQLLVSRS